MGDFYALLSESFNDPILSEYPVVLGLVAQNELGHTVPAFGQQCEVSGTEEKCWESRKEKEIRVGEVREGFLEEAGP